MVVRDMSQVLYTAFESFDWIMLLVGPGPTTIASSSDFMPSVTSRMYRIVLRYNSVSHNVLRFGNRDGCFLAEPYEW